MAFVSDEAKPRWHEKEVVFSDPTTGVQVQIFTMEGEQRFAIVRPALPIGQPWDGASNGMSMSAEEFQALALWITREAIANAERKLDDQAHPVPTTDDRITHTYWCGPFYSIEPGTPHKRSECGFMTERKKSSESG